MIGKLSSYFRWKHCSFYLRGSLMGSSLILPVLFSLGYVNVWTGYICLEVLSLNGMTTVWTWVGFKGGSCNRRGPAVSTLIANPSSDKPQPSLPSRTIFLSYLTTHCLNTELPPFLSHKQSTRWLPHVLLLLCPLLQQPCLDSQQSNLLLSSKMDT